MSWSQPCTPSSEHSTGCDRAVWETNIQSSENSSPKSAGSVAGDGRSGDERSRHMRKKTQMLVTSK
jgi:hypothetical protein